MDAKKTKHYVAWQTLNSAVGKLGNAGRADALEDLNGDGISLRNVDLTGAQFFEPLTLTNASLNFANLTRARFKGADFSLSAMNHVTMDGGICEDCDFRGVSLFEAVLTNAFFSKCDFGSIENDGTSKQGDLSRIQLCSSTNSDSLMHNKACSFNSCNFAGVKFESSHWDSPKFINCNFANADMKNVVITETNGVFINCNIFGVTNAPPAFMNWAASHGAISTNIVSYEEWLDCINKGRTNNNVGTAN